ncbi:hypothetical protein Cgig2_015889 [Carnegiea gigantea]|uniref:Uncharacterized protein n=1 Tax=Carnegiea gigantea TaxID=171969 RepID=A0A9Q1GQL7_9CARY|nr:hypothetical protein Cgig2_015889 [Carnegiea gigantea]
MKWIGAYYSWMDKRVWSRIDRFNFPPHQDHRQSSNSVNVEQALGFWLNNSISSLNNSNTLQNASSKKEKARQDLINLQHTLIQDPCNEELIQQEMEIKKKYIDIIKYGDDKTRLFHTKAKQRKLATYIYCIRNANGLLVEGFDQVSHTMLEFYKVLLGKQQRTKKEINLQVIQQRPTLCLEDQVRLCKHLSDKEIKDACYSITTFKSPGLDGYNSGIMGYNRPNDMLCSLRILPYRGHAKELQQQCLEIIGLIESSFPFKYLGVHITTSRLTKIECRGLVDKILAKVHLWATFVRRAKLISNVIFGMFKLLGHYLLVISRKKDILWVRWVHRRYLKDSTWWEYTPGHDCS